MPTFSASDDLKCCYASMQSSRRTKAKEYSRQARVAGTRAKRKANKANEIADDVLLDLERVKDAFRAAWQTLNDVALTATVS
jgi:hypothetical protein